MICDDSEGPAGKSPLDRRAALAQLIEEHQQAVGGYLLHLLGESEAAVALTRETFVQGYRAKIARRPDLPVRQWLFRAATRLAYSYLRRKPRSVLLPRGGVGRLVVLPAEAERSERALVQSVLRDLAPTERVVLLLCDLEQLPHAEAAAIMSVSPELLHKRLARARASFRRAYLAHDAVTSGDHNGHPADLPGDQRPGL